MNRVHRRAQRERDLRCGWIECDDGLLCAQRRSPRKEGKHDQETRQPMQKSMRNAQHGYTRSARHPMSRISTVADAGSGCPIWREIIFEKTAGWRAKTRKIVLRSGTLAFIRSSRRLIRTGIFVIWRWEEA